MLKMNDTSGGHVRLDEPGGSPPDTDTGTFPETSRIPLDDSVGMETSHFSSSALYEELFFSRPSSTSSSSTLDHDVVKRGYLGKTERSHQRYFVLREESHTGPRRLEWFVAEEKFNTAAFVAKPALFGPNKQRVIYLRCCVSVSRIASPRKGHTVAVYAKDQTLLLIAEDQQQQEEWYLAIKKMIGEERDVMEERKDLEDGRERLDEDDDGYCTLPPTAIFKEVWPVTVKPRGLGRTKSLLGETHLCLSASSLLLARVGSGGELPPVSLPLLSVRRFGHAEGLFFLELGRSAPHGPGEIWMEVGDQGDSELAQHMHEVVRDAVRELRALPDFSSRSPAASHGFQSQPRLQPAAQRPRSRGREKAGPVKPAALSLPPSSRGPSNPEPRGPESPPVSDVSMDCSLPVATGTEGRGGGVSAVTEERGCVAADEVSGWEDDEEEKPGYMMMSPQRRRNSEDEKPDDDYVTMGSPLTDTLQPASSSSPIQKTYTSYAVHQLNQSCIHTQPDWLFPELQQLEREASQLQVLNLSDSQELALQADSFFTLPEQTAFASHPMKIDILFSLFTPIFSTAGSTPTKSKPNRNSPVRPAADQSTVRRFWLSSCLPFCLQAEDKL